MEGKVLHLTRLERLVRKKAHNLLGPAKELYYTRLEKLVRENMLKLIVPICKLQVTKCCEYKQKCCEYKQKCCNRLDWKGFSGRKKSSLYIVPIRKLQRK
jgi:hypothetical protein